MDEKQPETIYEALTVMMDKQGYQRPQPRLYDCKLDDEGNLWRIHTDKFGQEIRRERADGRG